MDDELLAFLRATADHPDDAVAPLVFADWLEERNDPRAGYIRLAHDWLLADQAAAADPSTAALNECYLAMMRAKAAFLPLLNTALRPCLQSHVRVATALGYVEALDGTPEKLARVTDPTLTCGLTRMALAFWPNSRVPDALHRLWLPLLRSVEIAPWNWDGGPHGTHELFLEIVGWLDRPALSHVREVRIRVPGGSGMGDCLAWLQHFEPPEGWASKTIRVLPPLVHGWRVGLDNPPVPALVNFVTSPFARYLSSENRDELGRPPSEPAVATEVRDFFRCTNERWRAWNSPAERSPGTARAIERAVRARTPAESPSPGNEVEVRNRPLFDRQPRRQTDRRRP